MSSVVIAPGLHNSGPNHWQTVWQQRLPNAKRVHQQRWDHPDLDTWADALIETVNKHDARYIVAHSFGCLATVHAIAALQHQIRAVLLVAPADPEKFGVDVLLPHTPLPIPGLIIGSLTDPWLSWSKAQLWSQRWELPIYCAGDAGHVNAESGHSDWSEGWALLQHVLSVEDASPKLSIAPQSLQRNAYA